MFFLANSVHLSDAIPVLFAANAIRNRTTWQYSHNVLSGQNCQQCLVSSYNTTAQPLRSQLSLTISSSEQLTEIAMNSSSLCAKGDLFHMVGFKVSKQFWPEMCCAVNIYGVSVNGCVVTIGRDLRCEDKYF